MDRVERTSLIEHLALQVALPLQQCCDRFREVLQLPEFKYDAENEGEWGFVEVDNVEYNLSRPFEAGTLQDWDDSVPRGCNCGISLSVYREHAYAGDHDWALHSLVVPVGQALADAFQTSAYYHRTWFGPGQNTKRDLTFEHPRAEQGVDLNT